MKDGKKLDKPFEALQVEHLLDKGGHTALCFAVDAKAPLAVEQQLVNRIGLRQRQKTLSERFYLEKDGDVFGFHYGVLLIIPFVAAEHVRKVGAKQQEVSGTEAADTVPDKLCAGAFADEHDLDLRVEVQVVVKVRLNLMLNAYGFARCFRYLEIDWFHGAGKSACGKITLKLSKKRDTEVI